MKIAIYGGSFNPVHREHVNILKAAVKALSADKAIVVPSCITPFKSGKLTVSGEDRLNMCRIAFSDIACAEVSPIETERGGVSYSFITCRALKSLYPHDELYFVLGGDMLESFPKWKNPQEILDCVTLAVCAREDGTRLDKAVEAVEKRFGCKIVKTGYVGAHISSTKVRTLAALGGDFGEYVSEKEADYIKERSLYSLPALRRVKDYLTPERWRHTLGVAVMAAENCARIGVSEEVAITAAALHDCAKYLKADSPELRGFVPPYGVPDPVLHQYSGAYVAEHTFKITDLDVLNAIRYHTSGRENMQELEKLLYLCDMLEEGRNFAGVKELREIFSRSIDECMYAALRHQIEYLKTTGGEIYPLTLQAYEYLKEQKQ